MECNRKQGGGESSGIPVLANKGDDLHLVLSGEDLLSWKWKEA